jgi:hypothetical protein
LLQYLLEKKDARETRFDVRYLTSDYERHDFGSQPKPLTLDLKSGDQVLHYIINIRMVERLFTLGWKGLPVSSLFGQLVNTAKVLCFQTSCLEETKKAKICSRQLVSYNTLDF